MNNQYKVRMYGSNKTENQIQEILSLFLGSGKSELKIEIVTKDYHKGYADGHKAGYKLRDRIIIDEDLG